jgi:hypothetical protein
MLAVRQLTEAYEMTTGSAGCGFFACPGSDGNQIVGMMTCRACAAHILLRRALKRMGIL